MSLNLKHTEASFSPSPIDLLYLRVAEMPRKRDMVIFVQVTDDRCWTDKSIALPLLHRRTRGNLGIYCRIHTTMCTATKQGVLTYRGLSFHQLNLLSICTGDLDPTTRYNRCISGFTHSIKVHTWLCLYEAMPIDTIHISMKHYTISQ